MTPQHKSAAAIKWVAKAAFSVLLDELKLIVEAGIDTDNKDYAGALARPRVMDAI